MILKKIFTDWIGAGIIALSASACVNPQQVDLLEREQRRMRSDMSAIHSDTDGFRATLADTRANIQQLQRDISAMRERIDETKTQVGRQLGQTNREGDQRVKNLESRLAKLEEEAKAQAELLRSREEELQQLRPRAALTFRSPNQISSVEITSLACAPSKKGIIARQSPASRSFSRRTPKVSWPPRLSI
jgi:septal ring factor EnvC (AmiA/AmiB activator)